MNNYLLIAAGGALGALSRYIFSAWISVHWGDNFPWGTLLVNGCGCLLMGILAAVLLKSSNPESIKLFLMVGFLGAFTTFSTFSLQTIHLIENGQIGLAFSNILASVVICLAAVALGLKVM